MDPLTETRLLGKSFSGDLFTCFLYEPVCDSISWELGIKAFIEAMRRLSFSRDSMIECTVSNLK
jgi:hypothetical protein